MLKRRLRTSALMTGAAAGLLTLGLSTSAQASPDDAAQSAAARAKAACPVDNVCFFPEPNFGGTPSNVNPANLPVCGKTPIIAKSVVNHSADVYSFYDRTGCAGGKVTLNPGQENANLSAVSWR
ncbi:peptidase inhibitor family I36 protein [Streptomyces tuirus]|uniref:Peptidase inhibitor family I36 protein n=1 Tax=Streptomyces tuirus TaxID=68278 RepID=A0A941FBL9_9ACTN|nr:peptidase inhibitor family I36 protein [Streptomyces tuirus]